jgi:DNA-binding response OmpR family regulator
MERGTILYVSDQPAGSNFVSGVLKTAGYEVVSTSPTQAIAQLFLMRSVAAVVLNLGAREQTSFDVERSLRAIRPDVPIILLCDQMNCLPSCVAAYLNNG